MSRTRKDTKWKFHSEPWDINRYMTEYFSWIYIPGMKTKKRKEVDTEDHWMGTPSLWNRLQHTRPRRAKARVWARNVEKTKFNDVEELYELDVPNYSNKPHIYYW